MQNIEEIYKKHSNTVYKYLFCLTHNENISEELTQETFAIAVKEIHKFRGNCKVSVWLCQIAKHLWYKEFHKKSNKDIPIEDMKEDISDNITTEDIVADRQDRIYLFKKIQMLDELSKEVVYLRILGNLEFSQIGEILGRTSNWARVIFYRAKQKIKEDENDG